MAKRHDVGAAVTRTVRVDVRSRWISLDVSGSSLPRDVATANLTADEAETVGAALLLAARMHRESATGVVSWERAAERALELSNREGA